MPPLSGDEAPGSTVVVVNSLAGESFPSCCSIGHSTVSVSGIAEVDLSPHA